MGYNIEFIQVPTPKDTTFPIEADRAKDFLVNALPFDDMTAVRETLLGFQGSKPGPGNAIDFLGAGMSYARLYVRETLVYIENNCSARELMSLYNTVAQSHPSLLIHDLQSGQLHTADSYMEWWSRPL